MVEILDIVNLIIRELNDMESGVFLAKWVLGLVMIPLKTKCFLQGQVFEKKIIY